MLEGLKRMVSRAKAAGDIVVFGPYTSRCIGWRDQRLLSSSNRATDPVDGQLICLSHQHESMDSRVERRPTVFSSAHLLLSNIEHLLTVVYTLVNNRCNLGFQLKQQQQHHRTQTSTLTNQKCLSAIHYMHYHHHCYLLYHYWTTHHIRQKGYQVDRSSLFKSSWSRYSFMLYSHNY